MVGIYSHETYTLEKFKINPTDAHLTYLPNEAKIIGKEGRPQVGEYLTEKVNSWEFSPTEIPDNVFILKEKSETTPSIQINIDNFVSAMSELKTKNNIIDNTNQNSFMYVSFDSPSLRIGSYIDLDIELLKTNIENNDIPLFIESFHISDESLGEDYEQELRMANIIRAKDNNMYISLHNYNCLKSVSVNSNIISDIYISDNSEVKIFAFTPQQYPFRLKKPKFSFDIATNYVGSKQYELTDHLGNVRNTFTDYRNTGTTPATPSISQTSAVSYYAFGLPQYNNNSNAYRFGFNGKEKDDEWTNTTGATYDYGFRIYDARIGRFLSVDPLFRSFPWNSPYSFAENDVIRSIDLDGLERIFYTKKIAKFWKAYITVLNSDKVLKEELFNDIHKPELKDKVWIYFTSGSSTSMKVVNEAQGKTRTDVGRMAYFAVLYENIKDAKERE